MKVKVLESTLQDFGIELLGRRSINLDSKIKLEAYSSLKFAQYEGPCFLGSWSYVVSGFVSHAHIGRYCSIGEDVQIGRQSHPTDLASTSPVFYLPFSSVNSAARDLSDVNAKTFARSDIHVGVKTVIGNDVYIGHGAIILAGVTVGTGSIIGAGTVVTKEIPPFSVAVGNPAKVVKMRFEENKIRRLLESEWWRFMPWELPSELIDDIESFTDQVDKLLTPKDPLPIFCPEDLLEQ